MNIPYPEDCGSIAANGSVAEVTFNDIDIALKILAEAVQRIEVKTSDVRYCTPCKPSSNDKDTDCSHAPLIMRLREIKTLICRNADYLNGLSDEIQL